MVYLVTWDLNKEKPNYDHARDLFLLLFDSYDNIKDSGLDSVRFISTSETVSEVFVYLKTRLDEDDRIIITLLTKDAYAGRIKTIVSDWISQRI